METEIFQAGGWVGPDQKAISEAFNMPALSGSDISAAVMAVLSLPHNVDIALMLVKPVGEKF